MRHIKVVSGGQTGADRGCLDGAIAHGIPQGGWCPEGRLAEEGVIPAAYDLKETPSADYPIRTEWNPRDAGATGGWLTPLSQSQGPDSAPFSNSHRENIGKQPRICRTP